MATLLLALAVPLFSAPLLAQGADAPQDVAAAEARREAQREGLERELTERYRDWTVRELHREERRRQRILTETSLEHPRAQVLADESTVVRNLLAQRAAAEITPHLMHRANLSDSEETRLERYDGLGLEEIAWEGYLLLLQRRAEIETAFKEAFDAGLYDSEVRAKDEVILLM